MAGDRLDKNEPTLFSVMDNDVGHLTMFFYVHTQLLKRMDIKIGPFRLSIAYINYTTTWCKEWAKILNDSLYQYILSTR